MLANTLLRYRQKYSRHKLYKIKGKHIINTETKEKIKLPFANLPFVKYIVYNGLTDEFYVSITCYIAPRSARKKSYALSVNRYHAALFYMFYSIPDLKFVGFGKKNNFRKHNAFLPINNTVIRHVNDHTYFITNLANIPLTDTYGLKNFAGENIIKNSSDIIGVYENVFIYKHCYITKLYSSFAALIDLKQKAYILRYAINDDEILFNILI